MSFGTVREKKNLKSFSRLTIENAMDLVRSAGDNFAQDYTELVNDRASDRLNSDDREFLESVRKDNFSKAFEKFTKDVERLGVANIINDTIRDNTNVNTRTVSNEIKRFFASDRARGAFMSSTRTNIKRILDSPLKSGLSRTIYQEFLQERREEQA